MLDRRLARRLSCLLERRLRRRQDLTDGPTVCTDVPTDSTIDLADGLTTVWLAAYLADRFAGQLAHG